MSGAFFFPDVWNITAMTKDKTNAMRALEARNIPYQVFTFSPDVHSAVGVAMEVGLPANQVYKTLVALRSQEKPILIIIAGDRELDLKKVSRAIGEKKVRMASHNEAESLTGLQVGGISALALLNRPFDVFIDQPATNLTHILVSAGKRGIFDKRHGRAHHQGHEVVKRRFLIWKSSQAKSSCCRSGANRAAETVTSL
jgi:Cys-tRNA(Pro)/Cys-tRNA(Cys) deacylase